MCTLVAGSGRHISHALIALHTVCLVICCGATGHESLCVSFRLCSRHIIYVSHVSECAGFACACASQDTLTKEFSACGKEAIDLVNKGKLTVRLKGKKKENIALAMAALRKKTVEVIKFQSVDVVSKQNAVRLIDWQADHPGKRPEDQNLEVMDVDTPEFGICLCVVMRKEKNYSWEIQRKKGTSTLLKETYENGDARLRDGQEAAKYRALESALAKSYQNRADAATVSDFAPAASASSSSRSGLALGKAGPAKAVGDDESSDADGDSDEGSMLKCDPFAGSLLAGLAGSASRGSVGSSSKAHTPNKAKANPKAASSAPGSGSRGRSRSRSPRGNAGDDGSATARKGRGKGAKIPITEKEVLAFEGFDKKQDDFQALCATLGQQPFDAIASTPQDLFQLACMSLLFERARSIASANPSHGP